MPLPTEHGGWFAGSTERALLVGRAVNGWCCLNQSVNVTNRTAATRLRLKLTENLRHV